MVELCRVQRRSVIGGMAASRDDAAAKRVLHAVRAWSSPGPAHLVGAGRRARRVRVEDAIYHAAALSMALDFDDYVCFGHTGHSAVLVPLLLAAETDSSGSEQLLAQLAANEVEARLGGACLIGPQNGQLWSFIHSAGAAVSASRLLGLTPEQTAHALALSLYQPPRATAPGFFMPDSKLLTAAEPAVAGLRAARLAASGVTGPLDALDHPQGFLSAFADVPLVGVLGALGEGWATTTLCVKPYPGCAYIDTALDALGKLGWPRSGDVERVEVDASILTCVMDSMSAHYASDSTSVPTPVVVTFSIAWSIAVALVAGEPGPAQVDAAWLQENSAALRAAAAKVRLRHDPSLTREAVSSFASVLPPGLVARAVGPGGLARAAASLRRSAAGSQRISALGALRGRGILGLGGDLSPFSLGDLRLLGDVSMLRDLLGEIRHPGSTSDPMGTRQVAASWWDPDALGAFAMAFPARVTLRMKGHETRDAYADVPRGAAGHPSEGPSAISATKLRDHGAAMWGQSRIGDIDRAISEDDPQLWTLLG